MIMIQILSYCEKIDIRTLVLKFFKNQFIYKYSSHMASYNLKINSVFIRYLLYKSDLMMIFLEDYNYKEIFERF